MEIVIIGRKVLKSMECGNRLMLEASLKGYGDIDDAGKMYEGESSIRTEEKGRDIAAELGESLYHSVATTEDNEVNWQLGCLEFGDDLQGKKDAELQKYGNEAVEVGF